jgi:hypothetical protein
MNKLIQAFTLTIVAATIAIPASAGTNTTHGKTKPGIVHNGNTTALNPQPLPPRKVNLVNALTTGSSLVHTLFNPQPDPPGKQLSTKNGGKGKRK